MCDGGIARRPAPVVVVLAALAAAAGAEAEIIDVPADYATIQAAINASEDGDVVVVAPGTYTGIGNRDLDFGGRAITVRSADPQDAAVVAATVINCLQAGRAFFLHSGETVESVIAGFTITNGFATDGAGVYVLDASGATIRNCVFSGNFVPSSSGVIQSDNNPLESASLLIEGCMISGNVGGGVATYSIDDLEIAGTAISFNTGPGVNMSAFGSLAAVVRDSTVTGNGGAGLVVRGDLVEVAGCLIADNAETGLALTGFFNGSAVLVANCTITGNTSAASTGGLACQSDPPAVIRNCEITGNTGRSAGGLSISGFGAFQITGCTVSGNTSTEFGGGGIRAFGTDPTVIENCILWGNIASDGPQLLLDSGFNNPAIVSVDFCDVQGGAAEVSVEINCCDSSQLTFGPANIDVDPLFVDPDAGDYHLAAGSPAVDAGNPKFVAGPDETDLDGDPRVVAGIVDLGADEFRRPADLDGDGAVNVVDLLSLLGAWGPCPAPPASCAADLDGDGAVGVVDLLALLADWSL